MIDLNFWLAITLGGILPLVLGVLLSSTGMFIGGYLFGCIGITSIVISLLFVRKEHENE